MKTQNSDRASLSFRIFHSIFEIVERTYEGRNMEEWKEIDTEMSDNKEMRISR